MPETKGSDHAPHQPTTVTTQETAVGDGLIRRLPGTVGTASRGDMAPQPSGKDTEMLELAEHHFSDCGPHEPSAGPPQPQTATTPPSPAAGTRPERDAPVPQLRTMLRVYGEATSMRAELRAILSALRRVPRAAHLVLLTDSLSAIHILCRWSRPHVGGHNLSVDRGFRDRS